MAVRKRLLIAVVLAALTCGFAQVSAAASTSKGNATVGSAPNPGEVCVTVYSSVNGNTGSICVFAARGPQGKKAAEITFTSYTGGLEGISAATLALVKSGQVIAAAHNINGKVAAGGSSGYAENWWDEPDGPIQAGAYNACIHWTDGAEACTGPQWLYSVSTTL